MSTLGLAELLLAIGAIKIMKKMLADISKKAKKKQNLKRISKRLSEFVELQSELKQLSIQHNFKFSKKKSSHF